MQVTGKVALDPLAAELRMTARAAELSPYRPYVPMSAQLHGQAGFDLGVVLPPSSEPRATVRGSASLSRLDVRDGERTVMKVDRAVAAGIDRRHRR